LVAREVKEREAEAEVEKEERVNTRRAEEDENTPNG
jgi:hypothetical protein